MHTQPYSIPIGIESDELEDRIWPPVPVWQAS